MALIHSEPDSSDLPISPQSQVFDNSDLLESVFSFFHVPQKEGDLTYRIPAPDSQHLLWAALTCKKFFDPAMNILWRSMDSWTTLLKLIPSLTLQSNIYTTTELVSEGQLQRLNMYTRRVRRLQVTKFTQFVSAHIYSSISRSHHYKLFPGLTTLNIPAFGRLYHDNLNALDHTPSSTLSAVHIGGLIPSTEVSAASLLFSISLEAKSLVELHLSGQLTKISLNILDGFRNLETLVLAVEQSVLTDDFLNKCSRLAGLKSLCLKLDEKTPFICSSPKPANFEALQNFGIYGTGVHILLILGLIHTAQLEVVQLKFSSLGLDGSFTLVQRCLDRCSQLNVASVQVEVDVSSGIRLDSKALMAFQSCKQLSHLDVPVQSLTKLKMVHLCGNGEWQSIVVLKLKCDGVGAEDTSLSIYDLLILAKSCPNLRSLAISLGSIVKGADDIRMLESCITESSLLEHKLKDLKILPLISRPQDLANGTRDKTIKDAVVVSQFINNLFPSLDRLIFPEPKNDWLEGVKSMLKVYRGIRDKCKDLVVRQGSA